ncbi:homocysteine S-methyltransferase family protein [Sutterella wadsworthensis]|uniref:homocysteine S-methyltransferase family protein n=1 Tax=Sutterella wadsworthensis TaxID=40545 RepID=UPI003520F1E7
MALTKHPIADLIARRGGLVIDGAMSTPLEAAGLNLNDTLWSAKALLECPDLVRKVHYDYYAAGANAVEACSYQATEAAFARKGIEKAEASRLIRLSGELVREAKKRCSARASGMGSGGSAHGGLHWALRRLSGRRQ